MSAVEVVRAAPRGRALLPRLAAGGRAAHADEQPRPRGRRAARRPGRLRRHRQGGARLGGLRRDRRAPCARSTTTRPCWCSRASRSACSAPTSARRACSSPTRTSCRRLGHLGRVPARSRRAGLTMYGQMTAGSWIYIGTPGDPPGHLRDASPSRARQRFGGTLAGHARAHRRASAAWAARSRWRSTMNGGVASCVEVDPARIDSAARHALPRRDGRRPRRRARAGRARRGRAARRCRSGCVGNAADVFPELLRRGFVPDVVTDQTSAHDPLDGYVPAGLDARATRRRCASRDPDVRRARTASMAAPLRGHARAPASAAPRCSTTATTCAARRELARRRATRSTIPGFVPAYIRPLFCEGKGPFRWAALSGDPADIAAHRPRRARACSPMTSAWRAGSRWPSERVPFQGLPARICWLGYGERARPGSRFNELVRQRRVCRRRSSSDATISTPARWPRRTARPRRMSDGSDAIADWPILNAL